MSVIFFLLIVLDDVLLFRGLLHHPERLIPSVLFASLVTALIPTGFLLYFCPRVRKQSQ